MPKPNALVKISGDLLQNKKVINWLRVVSKKYSVVVLVGGGTQINNEFAKHGWPIEFGPLGRITKTLEKKLVASNILERNQAIVQDLFDSKKISVRVAVPIVRIADVHCQVNGDVMVLAGYNGFDRIFILTTKERSKKKGEKFFKLDTVFGNLEKIEIVSF